MTRTHIEWLRNPVDGSPGFSVNPVKGLCPVACPYCYARRMYLNPYYKNMYAHPEIRFEPEAFATPKTVKRPARFFVGSTIELFGPWVKPEWLKCIFDYCRIFPQHTFLFLTKRPQELVKWSPFPPNCHVGVSITNTEQAIAAVMPMAQIEAAVKFVSYEPLLEQVPTSHMMGLIQWCIIGRQTPVSARTAPKIEWIESIVETADKAGVRCFLKNNLKPLIQEAGMAKAEWAGTEWVQCKYPVLRQEMPKGLSHA